MTTDMLDKARTYLRSRDNEAVIEVLSEVDEDQLDETSLVAYALILGEASLKLGRHHTPILDRAVEILKSSDRHQSFSQAKFLIGWRLQMVGEHQSAKECLVESYAASLRAQDRKLSARVLNLLALVCSVMGETDQGIANLERARHLYLEEEMFDQSAIVSANLALTLLFCGETRKALRHYRDRVDKRELSREQARCVFELGYAKALGIVGEFDEATQRLEICRPLLEKLGPEKSQHLEISGLVLYLQGSYAESERSLKKALQIALDMAPESFYVSQVKRLLADVYVATGKLGRAHTFAKEGLALSEQLNERLEIGACHRALALIATRQSKPDTARQHFKEALELLAQIGSRYELAVTRYYAGKSDLYEPGERMALLYLAHEYFKAEGVQPFLELVEQELQKTPLGAKKPPKTSDAPIIIAKSDAIKKLLDHAEHIAQSEMTVLITGQTGTGKDLLASYIHHVSGREGRYVTLNAAAVPDSMVESELFGSSKGAFTGADQSRVGLIESADHGTFYLNEIADATPVFQAKLLEVLETKRVRRLGENEARPVAFRLIAATNHDLKQQVQDGKFRLDLFHRLNELPLHIPPLNDHKEDIPALVRHFLAESGVNGTRAKEQIDRLGQLLSIMSWPGNVRELLARVSSLYAVYEDDIDRMVRAVLDEAENDQVQWLRDLLDHTGWNRSRVADLLGVSEGAVRKRIKKYAIAQD